MADLLIRDISSELERRIKESASKNERSLSAEAKALIQRGLVGPEPPQKMGTFLFSLLEDEYRGDDLTFERNDRVSPPPNFE
jgi:plasmid stability protein